mgnify:CR=1 FL=1
MTENPQKKEQRDLFRPLLENFIDLKLYWIHDFVF